MQMTFDPLVPAELAAARKMLAALDGAPSVTVVNRTDSRITMKQMTPEERREMVDAIAASMSRPMHFHPPAGSRLEAAGEVVVITPQQADSMDDTGGIRSVGGPLPFGTVIADPDSVEKTVEYGTYPPGAATYAPSTAAAPASPSAPEAPQDGAAVDPSVFGQSAASAPVPAVPSAPVATASPAPGGERDVSGLPWDERIHSSSKARVADGSWRQRRNLPDGLREQVETELRGRSTTAGAPSTPTAPAGTVTANLIPAVTPVAGSADVAATALPTDTPAAPAVSAPPLPPVSPAVPAPPPVPSLPAIPSSTAPAAAPAPGVATASGEPMVPAGDFVALFGKVTKLIAEQPGVFGESDVEDMCERLGLPRKGGMMQLPGICMADAARGAELVGAFDAAVEGMFA